MMQPMQQQQMVMPHMNFMPPQQQQMNYGFMPSAMPPMMQAPVRQGKQAKSRFKKAPDAPKRFKSAFIIFSAEKHKKIKAELLSEGRTEKTTDIAKLVSEAWRSMPPEEKESWEEKARQDKARYEMEKAMYKGPWKIPANKRTPKDPSAPKRPMSAFLAFSNKRRAGLKRQNPDATNSDLSKMLSKTWKEAPVELKSKYMEEEARLRAIYKENMAAWRKKVADEKKAERKEREALAMQAAEARQNGEDFLDATATQGYPNMYAYPPMDQQQAQQQQQAPSAAQYSQAAAMNQQMNPFAAQQLLVGQNPQLLQLLTNPQQQGMGGMPPISGPNDAGGGATGV